MTTTRSRSKPGCTPTQTRSEPMSRTASSRSTPLSRARKDLPYPEEPRTLGSMTT